MNRPVLLVGRPNSGKSSLYNLLTGSRTKVGNFPGVTVDVLEGIAKDGDRSVRVVDLPGLYSLDPSADPDSDEGQARAFIEKNAGALVAQIADATHLAAGLRLTRELAKTDLPMVLVVTQKDALEDEGRKLDIEELERRVGVPSILVSASEAKDRGRLVDLFLANRETKPDKGLEPDDIAAKVVTDRGALDAKARRARANTERADRLLLHPILGPAVFLSLMTALFAIVFAIADPATQAMDFSMRIVGRAVSGLLGEGLVQSLVVDGVLGGAGTVLAFLPQIVILTVALEIIEASGYLSRGAFLVDRLLRMAGLGGRSFVPLLTAHACAVPAIGATRVVRDPGQRLRTILVLPLMTCSARIPTYALLIQAFFADKSAWVRSLLFVALYFAGILTGLLASVVLGRSVKRAGKSLPLVLEMPSYRVPQMGVVVRTAWRTVVRFVKDVGSGILIASLALWVLLTIPMPGAEPAPSDAPPRVAAMHRSIAARIGHGLEPVTKVAGFDWRINVGLIGSFGARELMVSTMGVIFGLEDVSDDPAPLAERIRDAKRADGAKAYDVATGLSLLAFFVVACQCISTLMAIRRETRTWRWPAFVLVYTYVVAFGLAAIVHAIAEVVV